MKERKIPEEMLIALLWLEAKNVLRGFYPSELFPDLTREIAGAIRAMRFDEFQKMMQEADRRKK